MGRIFSEEEESAVFGEGRRILPRGEESPFSGEEFCDFGGGGGILCSAARRPGDRSR